MSASFVGMSQTSRPSCLKHIVVWSGKVWYGLRAGDAEAAARQQEEHRQKELEAVRLKGKEADASGEDDDDNKPRDPPTEPVPDIVDGITTHKCRTFAGLLDEIGDFTSKDEPRDQSGFEMAIQGLNVVVYYDESLAMKSPLTEPDAFSKGPFLISVWMDDETDELSDDEGNADAKERATGPPELPPWLHKHIDRTKCFLDNPAAMQEDFFKAELPAKPESDGACLDSMANFAAASFTELACIL